MIKKYIYSKIHPSHLLLSFFLFVLPIIGASQNLTSKVVGKISDENGNPLVGVTVLVKGTNLGTATNGKGKFELESVSDTATLVFTNIGFESQEIKRAGHGAHIFIQR